MVSGILENFGRRQPCITNASKIAKAKTINNTCFLAQKGPDAFSLGTELPDLLENKEVLEHAMKPKSSSTT